MENKFYLGFDVGGENSRAVIADGNGHFEKEHIVKAKGDKSRGPLGFSRHLVSIAGECAKIRGISLDQIAGSAICSAGPFDFKVLGGSIVDSTNIKFPGVYDLDLQNPFSPEWVYEGNPLVFEDSVKTTESGRKLRHVYIPLIKPIKDATGSEVHWGNDVNLATIGMVVLGEGRDYGDPKDLTYTAVGTTHGTGFGTGIWSRGGIIWGVDGNAGEDGHFKLYERGMKCGCGNEGCAETFGSGSGSARNAQVKLVQYRFSSEVYELARQMALVDYSKGEIDRNPFVPLNFVDSKLVFKVFRENPNDRVAREVVEEAGTAIGRAYGMIACAYNPFFIGTYGSMTKDWDLLEERVKSEMARSCNVRIPDVFVTKLGEDAGLHGAIARAMGYGA